MAQLVEHYTGDPRVHNSNVSLPAESLCCVHEHESYSAA